MKATAALSLALAGSAVAAGAADTVNQVLNDINTALKSFDTAINGYSGGDATQLTSASEKIGTLTKDGAAKIASGSELTLNDAVSITTNVQGLQSTLDSTLADLEKIGPQLAKSGNCGTIKSQLTTQGAAAQALQEAITGKAPAETKSIAQQLGGKIGSSLKTTTGKFDQICAGAPSGSSSSGSSSAPSGGAAGGHSGHAGMGGSSGSSSSGSASSGSASSGSASSGSASSGSSASSSGKGSASSTVPKPAQFTGAASTLNAYRALGLGAVAAFFAL